MRPSISARTKRRNSLALALEVAGWATTHSKTRVSEARLVWYCFNRSLKRFSSSSAILTSVVF